ncbi:Leo1-like protein-domain-containing protein [Thamnocephalis sphaerospora]|uniref:Leo1-like protein-domain-containing protein n=1 Tax=Thamnocephalis sphaerospora TaxID=78915 RepID=A0A4P9XU44_9FUNG|nr:Leo1-like protein-domain-containing protein [Thamnocephalis sphaerospora]|eukprot:RKP09728.1 Leo1-like protein-domain-containing protein [Thamnocephalis sphaerospora]
MSDRAQTTPRDDHPAADSDVDSLFGSASDNDDDDVPRQSANARDVEAPPTPSHRRRGRIALDEEDEEEEQKHRTSNERRDATQSAETAQPSRQDALDSRAGDGTDDDGDDGGLFGSESEEDEEEGRHMHANERQHDRMTMETQEQDKDNDWKNAEALPEVEALQVHLDRSQAPTSEEAPPESYLARLPKHYQIDAQPFDPATYEAETLVPALKRERDDGDDRDVEESPRRGHVDEVETARRARQLRLRVQGTLRWRRQQTANGDIKLQSNARLIRWSDGTQSLYANGELFDVTRQPMRDEHHYAVTHHPRQGVLRVQRRLGAHLAFRSTSAVGLSTLMDVEAMERKKQTQVITTVEDPEQRQRQLAKLENERLRHERKIASYSQARSARRSAYNASRSALTVEDLEADEDDTAGYGRRGGTYADDFIVNDEEEEDIYDAAERRTSRASGRNARAGRAAHRRTRQYSDDDDDDDDEYDQAGRGHRTYDNDAEEDELERMERQLANRGERHGDEDEDGSDHAQESASARRERREDAEARILAAKQSGMDRYRRRSDDEQNDSDVDRMDVDGDHGHSDGEEAPARRAARRRPALMMSDEEDEGDEAMAE